MGESVTLSGTHVRLVPMTLEHVEALMIPALAARETFALTRVPATVEKMHAYVSFALSEAARGDSVPFVTVDAATNAVIGSTRFCAMDRWTWPSTPVPPAALGPDAVEIGWTWLAATAQRTAINTEAKLLMLTHAFETWRVRRVTLKTDSRNARSRAAIERLGCRYEGILRAHMPAADGGIRDSAMYSMLSAEWPEAKARLKKRLG